MLRSSLTDHASLVTVLERLSAVPPSVSLVLRGSQADHASPAVVRVRLPTVAPPPATVSVICHLVPAFPTLSLPVVLVIESTAAPSLLIVRVNSFLLRHFLSVSLASSAADLPCLVIAVAFLEGNET